MEDQNQRLSDYMQTASYKTLHLYVSTRAESFWRFIFETSVQTLCGWMPSLIGVAVRLITYRPLLRRNSRSPFIEAHSELFYFSNLSFGASVYIDSGVRIHASRAEISIGDSSRIMRNAYLCSYVSNARSGEGIVIGKSCWVGINSLISSGQGGVNIGDRVLIGPNVTVVTGNHEYASAETPATEMEYLGKPINIGSDVWIGANSVILGGVSIGEHSVIAAGAVVVHEVPPFTVVGGVPARFIKNIPNNNP
jgi:acetyltransferase-like isoleucine patch superfamily enzyme